MHPARRGISVRSLPKKLATVLGQLLWGYTLGSSVGRGVVLRLSGLRLVGTCVLMSCHDRL